MKVSDLIRELNNLYCQNGDLEVRVYSEKYFLDIHNIDFVRENERNGYHRIEIIIS